MTDWLATQIVHLIEAVIWFFVGWGLIAMTVRPIDWLTYWPVTFTVSLAFAALGPPLNERYGLPRWFRAR